MEPIYDIGITITLFIQNLGAWLLTPMLFFTFLGNAEFYLFIAPIIYWCLDASLGLRLGLLLMFSAGINSILKIFFHTPRPFWLSDRVIPYSEGTTPGVPSGHAQNALVLWGLIATWVRQWWMWIISILIILIIGFSRLYLGVHFIHDVLIGWLVGLVILILYIILDKPLTTWIKNRTSLQLVLIAFVISLAFIVFGFIARNSVGDWEVPEYWISNAKIESTGIQYEEVLNLSDLLMVAGAFFGIASGAVMLSSRGGFDAGGSLWHRVVRFFIGIAGVIFLYLGLKYIFPEGQDLIPYVFRYIRYALIAFWAIGLAPLLFIRFKIAKPQQSE